jgi:hypothetical protein
MEATRMMRHLHSLVGPSFAFALLLALFLTWPVVGCAAEHSLTRAVRDDLGSGQLVRMRDRWPESEPPRPLIAEWTRYWHLSQGEHELLITFEDATVHRLRIPHRNSLISPNPEWRDPTIGLSPAVISDGVINFKVSLIQPDGTVPFSGEGSLQVTHLPSTVLALEPVADEDMPVSLEATAGMEIYLNSDSVGSSSLYLTVPPQVFAGRTALGLVIELRDGDHLLGVLPFWASRDRLEEEAGKYFIGLPAAANRALHAGRPIVATVGSDPKVALRDPEATRYWSGKFSRTISPARSSAAGSEQRTH